MPDSVYPDFPAPVIFSGVSRENTGILDRSGKNRLELRTDGTNQIDPAGDLKVWSKTLTYTKYRYIGY